MKNLLTNPRSLGLFSTYDKRRAERNKIAENMKQTPAFLLKKEKLSKEK